MKTGARLPPTRQNLLALQRRLERVDKGTALLRRKREALAAELFRLARPAASARASIAARAASAYPLLAAALAREGAHGLRALGWPARNVEVTIRSTQVWGIAVAEIVECPALRRTLEARGMPPTGVSAAAEQTASAFEELAELLLAAANREALLRRLGEALARTSRQVNTLERRLGPALRADLGAIRRILDEREREEHLRLGRLLHGRQGRD